MSMDFYISGGELHIEKKVFIREMFRPDSVMKHLLNYKLEDQGKTRSLKLDKSATDKVVIYFNFVDKVGVGEDYQSLLTDLKKELKEKIKGSITLSSNCHYGSLYLTMDLNSEGSEIRQIL